MQYRDFILVLRAVERSEGSQPQKIMVQVFDSPVGQGEEEELIDIPGSLSASISDLDGRIFEKDENLLLEFGEMIGNILLPKYARNLFSMSYVRLREKEGLRLRLRLDDELADIPWECALVRDARGELTSSGFLALNPKVSIVRYEALPVPGDWFEAPGTRRVLVVMASPKNGVRELPGLLDEQRKLKAALSVVSGIEVDYRPDLSPQASSGPSATLEDLSLGLTKKTDVFHFAGHGEFDRRRLGAAPESSIGSGAIILCDQEKKPVFLPADRLAEMLRGKGVRLAVLGACEGARRDGHNVWSSVAAALLKAEIPAVVAMQFSIVDDLSAEFSAAFYRALVAGQTVDEAVSQGRAGIRLKALQEGCKNARDWCTPVLYLRSPGGGVFNPVSDEKVVAEAQSALDEVSQSIVDVAKAGEVIGTVIGGPKSTPTKVQQKVSEDLAGLMIGGTIFGEAGGKLTVIQDVNTVTGRMFGAVFDAKAGRSCSALTSLYEKLGVSARRDAKTEASGRICPNPECRRPVKPAWKFCGTCGTPLQCPKCQAHFDEVVASCPECGAKVQAN